MTSLFTLLLARVLNQAAVQNEKRMCGFFSPCFVYKCFINPVVMLPEIYLTGLPQQEILAHLLNYWLASGKYSLKWKDLKRVN